MKKLVTCILLIMSIIQTSLWAGSCSQSNYDKAEYFSEQAAQKIVGKYGGGQDIRMELRSCSYNSYSNIFKTVINIYWNGTLIRSNNYNIDGVLKFKSDGTLLDFARSYENQLVKDLNFYIGSIIVFAAIAEGSN